MKLPAIALTIVGGGLAMLSWSQTWFTLVLVAGAGSGGAAIAVPGQLASPALAALGLAALALAAAFALAGPGLRIVLAVLELLLGGCVLLAASLSLGDPVAAVAPAVTQATGVAGSEPTAALVAAATASWWPAVAIVGGVLLVLAGVVVLWSGSAWPASSRRYGSAKRGADASATTANDRAVVEWDELTRGDDPTGDEPDDDSVGDSVAADFDADGRAADEPGAADR
ncbi:Trp biosynthesis-associated membrane protein [Agromyces soli]